MLILVLQSSWEDDLFTRVAGDVGCDANGFACYLTMESLMGKALPWVFEDPMP